jgi:hypothetical protein
MLTPMVYILLRKMYQNGLAPIVPRGPMASRQKHFGSQKVLHFVIQNARKCGLPPLHFAYILQSKIFSKM